MYHQSQRSDSRVDWIRCRVRSSVHVHEPQQSLAADAEPVDAEADAASVHVDEPQPGTQVLSQARPVTMPALMAC